MEQSERLRRLALDPLAADLRGRPGRSDNWLELSLDAKTTALVRLAALLAMGGGSVPSCGAVTDSALSAGARVEEVVDVLVGVMAITGPVRVATAAPRLALALGYDIDDLPDPGPRW